MRSSVLLAVDRAQMDSTGVCVYVCVWTVTALTDNFCVCVCVSARLCGHGGCGPHIRHNHSLTLSFSVFGRSVDAIITSNRMDHGHKRANGRAALGGKCVITSQSMAIDRRCACDCESP